MYICVIIVQQPTLTKAINKYPLTICSYSYNTPFSKKTKTNICIDSAQSHKRWTIVTSNKYSLRQLGSTLTTPHHQRSVTLAPSKISLYPIALTLKYRGKTSWTIRLRSATFITIRNNRTILFITRCKQSGQLSF